MTYAAVPPPAVDPRQIRPARKWYWIGVGVGLAIILAGPAILYAGVLSAIPDVVAELDSGTPKTMTLAKDQKWAVFVDNPSAETTTVVGSCEGKGLDGGNVGFDLFTFGKFQFGKDGRTWQLQSTFTVDKDGQYSITCTATDKLPHRYAVGEDPEVGSTLGKLFGGFAAVLVLACVGLTVIGVWIAVVASRRSGYRKALQAQAAAAYAGHPQPGGYPQPAGYPQPGGYPQQPPQWR